MQSELTQSSLNYLHGQHVIMHKSIHFLPTARSDVFRCVSWYDHLLYQLQLYYMNPPWMCVFQRLLVTYTNWVCVFSCAQTNPIVNALKCAIDSAQGDMNHPTNCIPMFCLSQSHTQNAPDYSFQHTLYMTQPHIVRINVASAGQRRLLIERHSCNHEFTDCKPAVYL